MELKKRKKRVKRKRHERHKISPADEWIFMVIFLILLVFFISLLSKPYPEDEAVVVLEKLSIDSENANNKVAFIEGNKIDEGRLVSVSRLNYDQIKKELGIDKEFYMYIEDPNGKLIPINSKTCIGSSKAMVNGIRCG